MRSISCLLACSVLLLDVARAQSPTSTQTQLPPRALPGELPAHVNQALANPLRRASDVALDAVRQPGPLIYYAGIIPGSKIVELTPTSGYYTPVLSGAVGPLGAVYVFAPKIAPYSRAVATESFWGNTVRLVEKPLAEFAIPQRIDVLLSIDVYHRLHGAGELATDVAALNRKIFELLKPGGVYLVVDHAAPEGTGAAAVETRHRMDPELVKSEVMAAGFVLSGEKPILRRTGDDPRSDAEGHGDTADSFVLKFVKPGAWGFF